MSNANHRNINLTKHKKYTRETQTLRAGCSKLEPKKFAPLQIPFMGAQDGQNLISWRWLLPSSTDQVWLKSMHAISSYRGNRQCPPARLPQTGPITIHCAAMLSAQCKSKRQKLKKFTTTCKIDYTYITQLKLQT